MQFTMLCLNTWSNIVALMPFRKQNQKTTVKDLIVLWEDTHSV